MTRVARGWRVHRLVALACVLAACRRSDERAWDWERMREQRRADPYERSDAFADGMVMQRPPAGTVPYASSPRDRVLWLGSAADGRPASVIPVPVSPALLAVGRARFLTFCAPCHGAGGWGGSVVAMNLVESLPPPLRSAEIVGQPPGHIYDMIRNGRGRMPSYAAELDVRERWAVVAYVQRALLHTPATDAERRDSLRAAAIARRLGAPARGDTTSATSGSEPDTAGAESGSVGTRGSRRRPPAS